MSHPLFRKKSVPAILKEAAEGLTDAHGHHEDLKKGFNRKRPYFFWNSCSYWYRRVYSYWHSQLSWRPCCYIVICTNGCCMWLCSFLLCRVCVYGSGIGQRIHVFLCCLWRIVCLDNRVGSFDGICNWKYRSCHFMEPVFCSRTRRVSYTHSYLDDDGLLHSTQRL